MRPVAAPLVAVTSSAIASSPQVPSRVSYYIDSVYTDALVSCGLQPVVVPAYSVPSARDERSLVDVMSSFCGLLVTGGPTVPPATPPDTPIPPLRAQDPDRWETDVAIIRAAVALRLPILAICRGMQVLNEALDGTTHLNLILDGVTSLDHNQGALPEPRPHHAVSVATDSLLARLVRTPTLKVNSFHRQGVREPGRGLVVSAVSPDGVIEAIEREYPFCLGLQFHPERMPDSPPMKAIIAGFASACSERWNTLSRGGCRS